MKIDIAISFNDIIPPDGIGMVMGSKPPYFEQLLYLISSIHKNWNKNILDYSIRIYHSRPIHKSKIVKLIKLGCTVVYNPNEVQPYLSRENIFIDEYENSGDYTMVIDTDMLVLNTPEIENKKDIYVKASPNQNVINQNQWRLIDDHFGLKYHSNNVHHFNCGLFIMRNTVKKYFYQLYVDKSNLKILNYLETINRHLSIQIYYSSLIRLFDWGYLDKKMNVFSFFLEHMEYNSKMPIDILHYLGKNGCNNNVMEMIKSYKI